MHMLAETVASSVDCVLDLRGQAVHGACALSSGRVPCLRPVVLHLVVIVSTFVAALPLQQERAVGASAGRDRSSRRPEQY